jgi:hypothetical protein
MTTNWTEQDGIEYNELKKKIYYTEYGIEGLTQDEFNRFSDLNSKLEKVSLTNKTIKQDIEKGKADKKAGYYDKWYRYNRNDEGTAYDEGFNSVICEKIEGVTVIECVHN